MEEVTTNLPGIKTYSRTTLTTREQWERTMVFFSCFEARKRTKATSSGNACQPIVEKWKSRMQHCICLRCRQIKGQSSEKVKLNNNKCCGVFVVVVVLLFVWLFSPWISYFTDNSVLGHSCFQEVSTMPFRVFLFVCLFVCFLLWSHRADFYQHVFFKHHCSTAKHHISILTWTV